jgi:biotin-dependent carboxylase-like uncharacterized protein
MTALLVERADCLVLVEDVGRPGLAHLGVPRSGALDQAALALANRLVGNAESAAGLEILLGGLRLVAEESVRVALTGAQLPLTVQGRAAPWGTAVPVAAGAAILVGRATAGLRAWLAVAGGVVVPAVLGSRSRDTLSGLGPEPVVAGARIPLGRASEQTSGQAQAQAVPRPLPGPGKALLLRLHGGPRDDWFARASLRAMTSAEYTVSTSSDRIALRLEGPRLQRRIEGELPSEGLVVGAVQVPGDGRPLVFLADHPTTGGYPVVGVVHDLDLASCSQLRPGDRVRFVWSIP